MNRIIITLQIAIINMMMAVILIIIIRIIMRRIVKINGNNSQCVLVLVR